MEKIIYTHPQKPNLFLLIPFILLILISCVARVQSANGKTETEPTPNCGKLDVVPTDIRSFSPWTVAIFRRVGNSNSRWKFHTSGTIFSSGRVQSNQIGPPGRFSSDNDPRNFLIVAGVNTSDFSKHDEFAQYSRVKFILPRKTLYEIFFHHVFYYLVTPLDFSTPFVKAVCPVSSVLTVFNNPKNQFLKLAQAATQGAIKIPFPVSGFASRSNNYGNGTKNPHAREWTLKIWKFLPLPKKLCTSIFRFHYGQSVSPFCGQRTSDNVTSFLSGDEVLQKMRITPEYSQHDDDLCLSHGSRPHTLVAGTWGFGSEVTLIPRRKWGQCGFKTVYFASTSGNNTNEVIAAGQLLVTIEKCGDDQFPCASSNSSPCIPLNRTCDGIPDCEDDSDEHPNICAWKTGQKQSKDLEPEEIKVSVDLDPRILALICPDFVLDGVRCFDSETLENVKCTSPFYYGRRIGVECDQFYTAARYSFDHMDLFCNFDGEWEGLRPIHCQKECGILDEHNRTNKRFSWDITIYENGVEACGGTLIQPTVVLTDGRCLKNWIKSPESRANIQISLDFNVSLATDNPAKFHIKNAWVSRNSGDLSVKFEKQIALIQLGAPVGERLVDLKKTMTACFLVPPLNELYEKQMLRTGGGKIVVVSKENCAMGPKNGFCTASFLHSGPGNQAETGSPKIGSGLFFNRVESSTGKSKHILRGIFSSVGKDGGGTCTNVDSHADWILDILEANS